MPEDDTMYQYEVNEGGRIYIKSGRSFGENDFTYMAPEFAQDYHSAHDGWEAHWPVDMVIYEYSDDENGKELWRGSVDREMQPHFYAMTAKKQ